MTNGTNLQRETRWRAIVRRQMAGRWSAADFCRREGVALSTFHWWRRRLDLANPKEVQWVEAQGASLLHALPAGVIPAVRAGTGTGLWIEFAAPPAAELLAAALSALHSAHRAPC